MRDSGFTTTLHPAPSVPEGNERSETPRSWQQCSWLLLLCFITIHTWRTHFHTGTVPIYSYYYDYCTSNSKNPTPTPPPEFTYYHQCVTHTDEYGHPQHVIHPSIRLRILFTSNLGQDAKPIQTMTINTEFEASHTTPSNLTMNE